MPNTCLNSMVNRFMPASTKGPFRDVSDHRISSSSGMWYTDLDRLEAIHRTNEVRKSRDLAACVIDPLLMQAAQIRAEELAAASLYGHTRPDGRHYSTVVDAPIGENLHRVSNAYLAHKKIGVAQYIVDSWINSPGHFANIVNPRADAIGVGLAPGHNAKGESCWYCVQLFLLEGHTITVVDAPVVA